MLGLMRAGLLPHDRTSDNADRRALRERLENAADPTLAEASSLAVSDMLRLLYWLYAFRLRRQISSHPCRATSGLSLMATAATPASTASPSPSSLRSRRREARRRARLVLRSRNPGRDALGVLDRQLAKIAGRGLGHPRGGGDEDRGSGSRPAIHRHRVRVKAVGRLDPSSSRRCSFSRRRAIVGSARSGPG
jgi:hypothetical protein